MWLAYQLSHTKKGAFDVSRYQETCLWFFGGLCNDDGTVKMQMKMQIEKHLKFETQAENLISDVISEQTSLQLYCQSFANDKFRKQLHACASRLWHFMVLLLEV